MEKLEEVFQKVKQYVRQAQEKEPRIAGLSLGDISREVNIGEDQILMAMSCKALYGELVGTDIIICFNEEEDDHEEESEERPQGSNEIS